MHTHVNIYIRNTYIFIFYRAWGPDLLIEDAIQCLLPQRRSQAPEAGWFPESPDPPSQVLKRCKILTCLFLLLYLLIFISNKKLIFFYCKINSNVDTIGAQLWLAKGKTEGIKILLSRDTVSQQFHKYNSTKLNNIREITPYRGKPQWSILTRL